MCEGGFSPEIVPDGEKDIVMCKRMQDGPTGKQLTSGVVVRIHLYYKQVRQLLHTV